MKLIATLIVASIGISASALPLYEPFNYAYSPPATNLVGKTSPDGITWAQAGPATGGTNLPSVNPGNLTYPGLAPSIGNSAKFGGIDSTGLGARYSLPATVNSGTLYYSFVVQLSDISTLNSSGVFWAGFNNSSGSQATLPTVVGARVYTRSSGAGYNLGISKGISSTVDVAWDATVLSSNDVVFVVGSYEFVGGIGTDDIVSMWVNPSSSTFGNASPPPPGATSTAGNDISSPGILSFILFNRNANEPKTILFDELLISTNWAEVTPVLPAITSQPQSQRSLAGNSVTFNVSGYKIAGYQWRYYGTNLAGANSASLTIPNVQVANTGPYTVVATNGGTSVTSSVANLTVVADVYPRLRPLWNIPPNTPAYPYVTVDNTGTPNLRSIAYSAVSNQIIVASRTNYITGDTNPAVYVLDAKTGTNLYTLDASAISGGNLALTCIDVAEDGAVYAVNEVNTAAGVFKIYRWPDSASNQVATSVYPGGIPNGLDNTPRWGDTMRVRGAGMSTEIIADSNDGNWFAVFTPTDPSLLNFTCTVHSNYFGTGSIGRSLQFGATNSFYAKRHSGPMQLATFDGSAFSPVNVLTNYVNFPTPIGPVGFPIGSNLLCGIDFVSSGSVPDTLDLFEVSDLSLPLLLAKYNFPTNHQANGNFIGQVLFTGTNVYALDANNGISAFTLAPPQPTLSIMTSGSNVIISWPTNTTGFSLYSSPAASPTTWSFVSAGTMVGGRYQVSSPIASAPKFYRLQQ